MTLDNYKKCLFSLFVDTALEYALFFFYLQSLEKYDIHNNGNNNYFKTMLPRHQPY